MFKLYHGTTLTAAKDIMKNGFFEKRSTLWNCSIPGVVYLYDPIGVKDCNCIDNDEPVENFYRQTMELANENAQIQNAIQNNPDKYTVVLEFICSNDSLKEEFDCDASCPNMDEAVQIPAKTLNDLCKSGKIKIVPHYFPFCVKLSLAYLTGLCNNEYGQDAYNKLSNFERECLDALSKMDIPYEDLIWVEEIDKDNIEL